MLLWAADAKLAPAHANIVLWQGSARAAGVRSITEYIEIHAQEVRRRYLAWCHEFGETPVLGRRLRERFKLADGTSFWWHSAFVEQSSWKQGSLETMLKLFAFEFLLEAEAPAELTFAGSDRDVNLVLEAMCRRRGIRYAWSRLPRQRVFTLRALVRGLPRLVHGLMALAYFAWIRVALRRPPLPGSISSARRVLICGPFANHDANRHDGSNFTSRYWGTLPQLLAEDGYEVHWLHYLYVHDKVPTARQARKMLQRISGSSGRVAAHAFVESYSPACGIANIFVRWLAIAAESLMVGRCLRRRFEKGFDAYWPLVRDDWAKTFRGFGCVQNLFYDECFDRALKDSRRYDECVYLMENQGWERSLARAWHKYDHGRLTGVAHSTVRFWDLRYHCDPRRYDPGYRDRLPSPDCVALNGRVARDEYLATCAAREPVADCEALRYLHLVPGSPRDLGELSRGGAVRILLLGDYTRERTEALLRVAEGVCGRTASPLEIWVKPHPGCPIDPQRHLSSAFKIVTDPVATLVSSSHLVLASNTTSAALEAYVCGGRVLVFDDRSGVNYSPLMRVQGVLFVSDTDDLCRAINALDPGAHEDRRQTDGFFNIEPDLPGWRRYFAARPQAFARAVP
ncbi:MAG: TIGR04326 family surface carbohydrate biosynthesis protein [Steroidobacteraceae bacterium]